MRAAKSSIPVASGPQGFLAETINTQEGGRVTAETWENYVCQAERRALRDTE